MERVGGLEVPKGRVQELLERQLTVPLPVDRLEGLAADPEAAKILQREVPLPRRVPEVEDLDHPLLELLPVDPAVVVLVVGLKALHELWRRSRLAGGGASDKRPGQGDGQDDESEDRTHGPLSPLDLVH